MKKTLIALAVAALAMASVAAPVSPPVLFGAPAIVVSHGAGQAWTQVDLERGRLVASHWLSRRLPAPGDRWPVVSPA
jgi:TolA-binding protein